jgi:hypothetical protein
MAIRYHTLASKVKIDNRNGWGAVPYNEDIDYFGVRVRMNPATFLKLTPPMSSGEEKNTEAIKQHLSEGGSIGAPFLDIDFMEDYPDKIPKVVGHEGRHRMTAIWELYGRSVDVEVHLLPSGSSAGLRARHITPEMIERVRMDLCPEKKSAPTFDGPYFEVV